MPSQPTTEADDAPAMERLDASSIFAYSDSGGECPVEVEGGVCGASSALVRIGHVEFSLPCMPHARERQEAEEAEEIASRAARYLVEAGAWERIKDWSLDTYAEVCADPEGRAALAVARTWLDGFYRTGTARNLVLYGPVGSGKTGLGWGIVRDLCEHGVPARMVNFRTLLEQMKDAYSERVSVRKWLSGYFISPIVCFDDLGAEVPTRWARDQLLGLVDARYERGLPSIFISNYALGDLGRRIGHDDEIIGARIVSRMSEGATRYEVSHKDRRMAA